MNFEPVDLLLEYMTTVQFGSWESLQQRTRSLVGGGFSGLSPSQAARIVVRNLFALAHAEVAYGGDLSWRICPSSLVVVPHATNWAAALTGARNRELIGQLTAVGKELAVEVHIVPQGLAPSQVLIVSEALDDLYKAAGESDLPVIEGAAERMLRVLPSLVSMVQSGSLGTNPVGYDTFKFDPETGQWGPVLVASEDGAYRFDSYRPEYRLMREGQSLQVEKGVATHWELASAHRKVCRFEMLSSSMLVPATLRPPLLYDRAATLFSCRIPEYLNSTSELRYSAVTSELFDLFSTKLTLLDGEKT